MASPNARRIAMVALAGLLFASELTAQSKKPLKEITISLDGAVLNDTLPFDVPFIARVPVDAEVTDLAVMIAEAGSRETPSEEEAAAAARALKPTISLQCSDIPPNEWTVVEGRRVTDAFEMTFPPLEVNRFFCVRFALGPGRPMSGQEVTAFSNAARSIIDVEFRRFSPTNIAEPKTLRQLRMRIISALQAVESTVVPRPRENSIFDPRAPENIVRPLFLEAIRPIMNAQQVIANAATNFRNQIGVARASSDALRTAARILFREARAALPGIPQTVAGDPNWDKWPDTHSETFGTLLSALPTEPVWSGDALATVRQRITAVRASLDRGEQIVAALVAMSAAAPAPKPPAQTAAARLTPLVADFNLHLNGRPAAAGIAGVDGVRDHLVVIENDIPNVQKAIDARLAAVDATLVNFENTIVKEIEMLATSVGSFDTRHGWYVSADVGLAYAWDINETHPYLGTNIYFRPVNKDAPLQWFGSFAQSFTRRFSAMIGVTYTGDPTVANRREPLFGKRLLVVGAGLRLTDSIRVAAGGVLFRAVDPNPFITDRRIETTPFVSLSFDMDVVGMLGELGEAFGRSSTGNREQ